MSALRFQLFGFPIQILPGFWLLALLIGVLIGRGSLSAVFIVSLLAGASLLSHELGHAWMARRYGFKPTVTLHLTGGLTTYAALRRVRRTQDVLISFAGPVSGLLLASLALGALWASQSPLPLSGAALSGTDGVEPARWVLMLWWLAEINVFWSAMNLIPVMPFDGGRILLALIGDERRQLAALLSLLAGLAVALVFAALGEPWPAIVFAAAATISFRRLSRSHRLRESQRDALEGALVEAKLALDRGALGQARSLGERIFLTSEDPLLRRRAAEILLWALLSSHEERLAKALLEAVDEAEIDPHLQGAVAHAVGDLERAEHVLRTAIENGDSRVALSTLLVRVLFEAHRYREAACITLPISEQIPPEEARQVAREAERAGAHVEAARLSLRLAEQESTFRDARAALFSFVAAGAKTEATEAYRLAFGIDPEQSQELLSDERLSTLRAELQAFA